MRHMLENDHPLCREDIVWTLGYIKKRVAEEDPLLLDLPQPRLLQNFRYFAEVAMLLIHRTNKLEHDNLKRLLGEAAFGLFPEHTPNR